jgi:hypothetical protein
MKCPKCQTGNPEGMKFCGTCGAQLERICPSCNFRNPPQFRFCGECGHDLALSTRPIPKELSFDEKLAKIQCYLPQGLTEKILAQRGQIEGERKQVTVMFCDMEGFTTLTGKLGSEETYALMDQIYEILIHKVLFACLQQEKDAKGRRKYFPLLTKGDEGGLDHFFHRSKIILLNKLRKGGKHEIIHHFFNYYRCIGVNHHYSSTINF